MNLDELLGNARSCLSASPYCFITTVGPGGSVSTRVVQQLVADDLTIWFGTSPRSRKVRDLHGNAQMVVAAYAPARLLTWF